eukprot:812645-Ditylum_brightwellii.AAC.1
MKNVAQGTLQIHDLGRDPVQDPGEMATLPKAMRSTPPLKKPARFGEVFHFDIVYGTGMAIGGYRCVLWLVDCTSRYVF